MTTAARGLWPWALFAAMIAAAGLPLYIHAPKLYAERYGIGLGTLGAVLGGLRLLDVVQDPALGWIAERFRARRGALVAGMLVVMAAGMLGLLTLAPPVAPVVWFALTMGLVTLAYSFLTIAFYAQGVDWARSQGGAHLRLAGWREAGTLFGVSAAAVLPSVLPGGAASFGWVFVALAVAAGLAMRGAWQASGPSEMPPGLSAFRPALADRQARWLLVAALVNSMPVAVTSTLFLFFVEDRLELPTLSGPFLLVFFLSAAASAPVWSRVAAGIGPRRTLMVGMALAIAAFLWAASLGPGQGVAFGVICVASGAALGADLVLLPALFARRLGDLGNEAAGFSLWALVSKLALALSAATVLPALQAQGFQPGAVNTAEALSALSLTYAALPCVLKAAALAILWRSPIGRE